MNFLKMLTKIGQVLTTNLDSKQNPIYNETDPNGEFDKYISQNFDVCQFDPLTMEIEKIPVGEGSYSLVFHAYDNSDKNNLNTLALRFQKIDNIALLKKELIIIKILQQIDPEKVHFVEISRIYKKEHQRILAMQYGEGNLQELIKIRRKIQKIYSEKQIFYILSYLVDALVLLHDKRIIHQDIKPGNLILFDIVGKYKLKYSDFGISFQMEEMEEKTKWLGNGTPFYFPPEINENTENTEKIKYYYPFKYDIYCLGIVILEMMGIKNVLIRKIKLFKKIEDLPEINNLKEKYKNLWPILLTMLESDPNVRVSSQDLQKRLKENDIIIEKCEDMNDWDLLQKKKLRNSDKIEKSFSILKLINKMIFFYDKYHNNISKIQKKFELMIKDQLPNDGSQQIFSCQLKFYEQIFLNINKSRNLPNSFNKMTFNFEAIVEFLNVWKELYYNSITLIKGVEQGNCSIISNLLKSLYIRFDPYFIRFDNFELFDKKGSYKCMDLNNEIIFLL